MSTLNEVESRDSESHLITHFLPRYKERQEEQRRAAMDHANHKEAVSSAEEAAGKVIELLKTEYPSVAIYLFHSLVELSANDFETETLGAAMEEAEKALDTTTLHLWSIAKWR